MISAIKKRAVTTLIIFIYRLALDLSYVYVLYPLYSYAGYNKDVNILKLVFSYIVFFIFCFILPNNRKKVSSKIIQLHFIVIIVPMLSVYGLANLPGVFMIMAITAFLLQIVLIEILPVIRIRTIKNARIFTISVLISLTIVTFLYLIKTQKFSFGALSLSNIYDLRAEREIKSLFAYFIPWQFRVINPAIIVISYLKKYYKLFSLGIILQTLLFFLFPNKEVILSILLIIAVLIYEKREFLIQRALSLWITVGIGFAYVIYHITNSALVLSVFPFRFLVVPAYTKFEHYLFFKKNPKLYYSEGMIGKLFGIEYPYDEVSGKLIRGGAWGNANTGYLAYAYDNSGFVGMILISFVMAALLKYLDSMNADVKFTFPLLVYPMLILNDGDILTLFLTGGLFLSILIIAVFSKQFPESSNPD